MKYSISPAPKPVFTDVQQSRYLIPFLSEYDTAVAEGHRPSMVQHSAADW